MTSALAQKTEEIRREIESQVEQQEEVRQTEFLSKAAHEGIKMHVDPGNGYEFALIPIDKIHHNSLSKRTKKELDPTNPSIKKLAEEIQARGGLLRPLLVYRKDGEYVLVKGHRRLSALKFLEEELTRAYILPAKPPMDVLERWVNGY